MMVSIDAEISVQAQAHLSSLTVSIQKPQLYGLVFPPTCSLPARLNLESSCHSQRTSAS